MQFLLSIILFVCMISNSYALEIGIVDLNRALNESEEGMRSKNLLESRGRQKQQEFKIEEEELMQIAEDLRNNPLLTPKAKQEKEQELQKRYEYRLQTIANTQRNSHLSCGEGPSHTNRTFTGMALADWHQVIAPRCLLLGIHIPMQNKRMSEV